MSKGGDLLRERLRQVLQRQLWTVMRDGTSVATIAKRLRKPEWWVWATLGGERKIQMDDASILAFAMGGAELVCTVVPDPQDVGLTVATNR